MKITSKSACALMIFASLAACQSSVDGLPASDVEMIRASSKTWVDTYNRNDWEGLAALFTPDAIMMPPNGLVVEGRDSIAKWEKANETGFRVAFKVEVIDGQRDFAYVRGRSCVFIPTGTGGYDVDVGKFLEVRKQQSSGEWLIEVDIFNSDLSTGADLLGACPFADLPAVK